MAGLFLLALMSGYVWAIVMLCKRARPYWAKALIVVIAVLIPTADAVYGRIKLRQMCKIEGGLHIYREVENVEGLYFPSPIKQKGKSLWLEQGDRGGYQYIEGQDMNGKYARLSLLPNGEQRYEDGIILISKYAYSNDFNKVYKNDTFFRINQFIQTRDTGEILSRFTNIRYAGGWFERFIGAFSDAGVGGAGENCGPSINLRKFVTKTLHPIQPTRR
jgi:hypothetical protein